MNLNKTAIHAHQVSHIMGLSIIHRDEIIKGIFGALLDSPYPCFPYFNLVHINGKTMRKLNQYRQISPNLQLIVAFKFPNVTKIIYYIMRCAKIPIIVLLFFIS